MVEFDRRLVGAARAVTFFLAFGGTVLSPRAQEQAPDPNLGIFDLSTYSCESFSRDAASNQQRIGMVMLFAYAQAVHDKTPQNTRFDTADVMDIVGKVGGACTALDSGRDKTLVRDLIAREIDARANAPDNPAPQPAAPAPASPAAPANP